MANSGNNQIINEKKRKQHTQMETLFCDLISMANNFNLLATTTLHYKRCKLRHITVVVHQFIYSIEPLHILI